MNGGQIVNSIVSGAIGGGIIVTVAGFVLKNWWLEHLKSSHSKELETYRSELNMELKNVQSMLDHKVFVSKAHYETEFESMKKIFKCATQAYFLIQGLRPMIHYGDPDETDENKLNRLNDRVNSLASIHDEFILLNESLMPFYPENVHVALNECAIAIRREISDIRTSGLDALHPSGYLKANKHQEAFEENYHVAAKVIRERIERLTILR